VHTGDSNYSTGVGTELRDIEGKPIYPEDLWIELGASYPLTWQDL